MPVQGFRNLMVMKKDENNNNVPKKIDHTFRWKRAFSVIIGVKIILLLPFPHGQ